MKNKFKTIIEVDPDSEEHCGDCQFFAEEYETCRLFPCAWNEPRFDDDTREYSRVRACLNAEKDSKK